MIEPGTTGGARPSDKPNRNMDRGRPQTWGEPVTAIVGTVVVALLVAAGVYMLGVSQGWWV